MANQPTDEKSCFIAVHVGAGYHAPDNDGHYRKACQTACETGLRVLHQGGGAMDGAAAAVAYLEDNPWTNAGTGSCLNLHGNVECDAGVMDGESHLFGAVGALAGIQNPVFVAKELVKEQRKGQMSLGRIPPSLLVGTGALTWARDHGMREVSTSDLISQKALSAYRKHKRKLVENDETGRRSVKVQKVIETGDDRTAGDNSDHTADNSDMLLDTVGVVCIDRQGNVSSAASSGGIALKHPGRVGQAAIYGSGCWAQNGHNAKPSVACCTTGCGEYLVRTLLAKECCDGLLGTDNASLAISTTFRDKFLKSPVLKGVDRKLGGALAVKCSDGDVELVWAHTTASMCVGYMVTGQKKARSHMSRLPDTSVAGLSLSVEGKHFVI